MRNWHDVINRSLSELFFEIIWHLRFSQQMIPCIVKPCSSAILKAEVGGNSPEANYKASTSREENSYTYKPKTKARL
jgi:hypothetical protein